MFFSVFAPLAFNALLRGDPKGYISFTLKNWGIIAPFLQEEKKEFKMADESDHRSVLMEIPEPQAKITGENNIIIIIIIVQTTKPRGNVIQFVSAAVTVISPLKLLHSFDDIFHIMMFDSLLTVREVNTILRDHSGVNLVKSHFFL